MVCMTLRLMLLTNADTLFDAAFLREVRVLLTMSGIEKLTIPVTKTELLDRYSAPNSTTPLSTTVRCISESTLDDSVIGFHNASFTWSANSGATATPSSRVFRLRAVDIKFKTGVLNLVVGPTGCGKTSVLLGLLGEMHFDSPHLDSWVNLPRGGGVAYCAQEAWLTNDTIKARGY